MSPQGRGRSPCRQEKLLRRPYVCSLEREKIGRAWNVMDREQQIIASTRDALLKEVEKVSKAMRVMIMWVEGIVEDVKNIQCDRCRKEGRVPERENELWSREPSIDKDGRRHEPDKGGEAQGRSAPQRGDGGGRSAAL